MHVRILTLLIAILIATLAAPGPRADEAPASIEQFNARLDRARATLDEVQKALELPELSDAALRSLRARIEPLPHELEETIEKLTPRLAAIDARLKELAPAAAKPQEPPKEAAKAPEKPAESKPQGKPAVKNGVAKPPPARGPPVAAPDTPFADRLPWGLTAIPVAYDPPAATPAELRIVPVTPPASSGRPPYRLQMEPARRLANLAGIPVLLVSGEYDGRAQTPAVAEYLRQAGCPAEHLRLQERGLRGNGAMVMLETNRRQVFDVLRAWIEQTART